MCVWGERGGGGTPLYMAMVFEPFWSESLKMGTLDARSEKGY